MTPEQAKDNLEFIKAFAEGKAVQFRKGIQWVNVIDSNFRETSDHYRIKPEPKYRPYTVEEAKILVGKVVIGKYTEHNYLITAWYRPNGQLRINNETVTPESLIENYKFTNGDPCGVLIE